MADNMESFIMLEDEELDYETLDDVAKETSDRPSGTDDKGGVEEDEEEPNGEKEEEEKRGRSKPEVKEKKEPRGRRQKEVRSRSTVPEKRSSTGHRRESGKEGRNRGCSLVIVSKRMMPMMGSSLRLRPEVPPDVLQLLINLEMKRADEKTDKKEIEKKVLNGLAAHWERNRTSYEEFIDRLRKQTIRARILNQPVRVDEEVVDFEEEEERVIHGGDDEDQDNEYPIMGNAKTRIRERHQKMAQEDPSGYREHVERKRSQMRKMNWRKKPEAKMIPVSKETERIRSRKEAPKEVPGYAISILDTMNIEDPSSAPASKKQRTAGEQEDNVHHREKDECQFVVSINHNLLLRGSEGRAVRTVLPLHPVPKGSKLKIDLFGQCGCSFNLNQIFEAWGEQIPGVLWEIAAQTQKTTVAHLLWSVWAITMRNDKSVRYSIPKMMEEDGRSLLEDFIKKQIGQGKKEPDRVFRKRMLWAFSTTLIDHCQHVRNGVYFKRWSPVRFDPIESKSPAVQQFLNVLLIKIGIVMSEVKQSKVCPDASTIGFQKILFYGNEDACRLAGKMPKLEAQFLERKEADEIEPSFFPYSVERLICIVPWTQLKSIQLVHFSGTTIQMSVVLLGSTRIEVPPFPTEVQLILAENNEKYDDEILEALLLKKKRENVKGMEAGLSAEPGTSRTRPEPFVFRCYGCNKPGHRIRDCPKRPESTRGTERYREYPTRH